MINLTQEQITARLKEERNGEILTEFMEHYMIECRNRMIATHFLVFDYNTQKYRIFYTEERAQAAKRQFGGALIEVTPNKNNVGALIVGAIEE